MGSYSFLDYPVAQPPDVNLWWLFRANVRQDGFHVDLSAAVSATSLHAAQVVLRDHLDAQDLVLSRCEGMPFSDCVIEADQALVQTAEQQKLTCILGPAGIASSREATTYLQHLQQPEFSTIADLAPWPPRAQPDEDHGMPPVADAMFFEQPERVPGVSDSVYAVIDGAKVFGLAERLTGSGLRHACLFKGQAEADGGDVAPWLVQLDRDHKLTRALFTKQDTEKQQQCLWTDGAAILLRSPMSFEAMRSHLRYFTMVVDQRRNVRMYFRFYDPLTVRNVFPNMPEKQLQRLMAGIACLLAPNPDQASLVARNMPTSG